MERITREYEVYKYEELDAKIQEQLLEKEIDDCINFYSDCCLLEDMKEYAKELLKKYFGEKAILKTVYYDLDYSQGSGAMIEFELKYYNSEILVKHYGFYYHERSFKLDYQNNDFLTDKRENYLELKIEEMNEEFTKEGYNLINYENFIEQAKENLYNYRFLIDGTIFD